VAGKFVMAAAARQRRSSCSRRQRAQCGLPMPRGPSYRDGPTHRAEASGARFANSAGGAGAGDPEDALKHPNWSMGPKINSRLGHACQQGPRTHLRRKWLFGLRARPMPGGAAPAKHRSLLVQFADGTMLAQLAPPSMTLPIQHVLLHPERLPGVARHHSTSTGCFSLDFRPVDEKRYPCMALARAAMMTGGVAPASLQCRQRSAVTAFPGAAGSRSLLFQSSSITLFR